MATKFVVCESRWSDYPPTIREFQCVKETAKFVWLDEYYGKGSQRQMAKSNDVFDTWQDAHAELMRRADERLNAARLQLQRAQGFAGNVRGMKPPITSIEESA